MKLSSEDSLILSTIKLNSSRLELEKINTLISEIKDWGCFTNTIIDRGIAPLFFKKLSLLSSANLIPTEVKNKLQQTYYITVRRSMILLTHFKKIAETFTAHSIAVIALKGIFLSENLYQDVGLRQFSDIDLLVKIEDGKKCIDILKSMGFAPLESSVSRFVRAHTDMVHYPAMILGGVSVEIHIKLHHDDEKYNLNLDEIWTNAVPTIVNGVDVFTLNTNDLLLYLCIHLDKHFKGAKVQFTCFNDIVNLIEKGGDGFDWDEVINQCKKYNCEVNVFKYIILVHKYMGVELPDSVIKPYSSLLSPDDELLFLKYLNGYTATITTVPAHFEKLKNLDNKTDKVRYIWDNLFPTKAFMISKYGIKHKSIVLFYYPYRYFIGIKGFIKLLRK